MKNIKTTVFIIALIILSSIFAFCFLYEQDSQKMIEVNHYKLTVDISKNYEELGKGLSGRKSLQENEGMLFVFPEEGFRAFWMVDMNFPLDIIWMNKNCKVVYIAKNLPPCEDRRTCPLVRPYKSSQYVLETVAGFTEKHQVYVGESLNICDF